MLNPCPRTTSPPVQTVCYFQRDHTQDVTTTPTMWLLYPVQVGIEPLNYASAHGVTGQSQCMPVDTERCQSK